MVKIVNDGTSYRIYIDGVENCWCTFAPNITHFIFFSIKADYFGAKEDIIKDFRSIL